MFFLFRQNLLRMSGADKNPSKRPHLPKLNYKKKKFSMFGCCLIPGIQNISRVSFPIAYLNKCKRLKKVVTKIKD
jgi:hypothetical protein